MKTNKVSTTTSTVQRSIVHALVVIDDSIGRMASVNIEDEEPLSPISNATNKTITSLPPLFPLRSCFKSRKYTEDSSRSLLSQLDYHVHFDAEKDSRWSNGCPSCKEQPLNYKKRNMRTTKLEI